MNKGSVAAGAGSNFRVRLFWKLQGWRLRNAAAQESSRSVAQFSNFMALNHRGNADAVCDLAESLTAHAAGVTPVSAAQVKARLARELGPKSCVTVLGADKGSVGGYAWGRVSTAADVLANCRQNAALASLDESAWEKLAALLGSEPCLVLYDLGLGTQYRRGFLPIKQLLNPLLELGVSHGARRAFWWTPAGGDACQLALAFGARAVLEREGIVFFVHDAVANMARVLGALPASAISTLLSRVVGQRKPREPARHGAPLRLSAEREESLVQLALDASAANAAVPVRAAALRDLVASNDVDRHAEIEEIEIFSRPQHRSAGRTVAAVASAAVLAGVATIDAADDVDAAHEASPHSTVAALAAPSATSGALADLPRRLSALFPQRAV